MKIFLIGMPGSGKTTLGRQLAKELALPFIDLDHEIEKQEGLQIKEIFAKHGEEYFRVVESKTLKSLAQSTENFVLSTGGGAPCFYDGIQIINTSGLSIFLDVPVHELVARVEKNTDRPLLSGKDETLQERLTNIRSNRLSSYQQAAIIFVNPTLQDVIDKLKK